MHNIEPFYNWRHIYLSEEDKQSPFYGRTYSEFKFSQTVYNFYIHPQWDDFGSRTLYLKVLLADYEEKYAIIEMIGEWNDAVENDVMELKREVLEKFMQEGIFKFILIVENVLNFHSDGKDYYEELFEEVMDENGWQVEIIARHVPHNHPDGAAVVGTEPEVVPHQPHVDNEKAAE